MRTERGALAPLVLGPVTRLRTERGVLWSFLPAAAPIVGVPIRAYASIDLDYPQAAITNDHLTASLDASHLTGRVDP